VRYWDLAATEPKEGTDPDYSASAKVLERDGQYWILNVRRDRLTPKGVEQFVYNTAMEDGRGIPIFMEQEPGSSGVNTIDYYARKVLVGFDFKGHKTTGSKEIRANPVSAAAENGNVHLVRGPWINDFLDEITSFPQPGVHDDMVDCVSGAFLKLTEGKERRFAISPMVTGLKRKY
jgi:predicted phage terminase large subunit-like protein